VRAPLTLESFKNSAGLDLVIRGANSTAVDLGGKQISITSHSNGQARVCMEDLELYNGKVGLPLLLALHLPVSSEMQGKSGGAIQLIGSTSSRPQLKMHRVHIRNCSSVSSNVVAHFGTMAFSCVLHGT
jgi:hypothetical protein